MSIDAVTGVILLIVGILAIALAGFFIFRSESAKYEPRAKYRKKLRIPFVAAEAGIVLFAIALYLTVDPFIWPSLVGGVLIAGVALSMMYAWPRDSILDELSSDRRRALMAFGAILMILGILSIILMPGIQSDAARFASVSLMGIGFICLFVPLMVGDRAKAPPK